MTTALATRGNSKIQGRNKKAQQIAVKSVSRPKQTLPEYLEPLDIESLLNCADAGQARLVMLCQWRAGLRVSEALSLEVHDLSVTGERPTLRIRLGKGRKTRIVPMHPELETALRGYLDYSGVRRGPLFTASRVTAWRWVQKAAQRAVERGMMPPGKQIGTHTLRHSAARHWLASGVPINAVSRWLGHASLQTTLIYLQLLGDPEGFMNRVP